jgi:hypothetical protein
VLILSSRICTFNQDLNAAVGLDESAMPGVEVELKKRGKGRKGRKRKEEAEEEKANSDDDLWRKYGSDEELDAPYLPPVRRHRPCQTRWLLNPASAIQCTPL